MKQIRYKVKLTITLYKWTIAYIYFLIGSAHLIVYPVLD